MTKNIKFVITRFVFFKLKMHQNSFSADPAGGAYDAPPDPLVGWGGGYLLPIPLPARRLRRLEVRRLGSQAPSTQNPGYASAIICEIIFEEFQRVSHNPPTSHDRRTTSHGNCASSGILF